MSGAKPIIVVVPVSGVSPADPASHSKALSISHQVVAVSVVMEDAGAATRGSDKGASPGVCGTGTGPR